MQLFQCEKIFFLYGAVTAELNSELITMQRLCQNSEQEEEEEQRVTFSMGFIQRLLVREVL